MSGGGRRWGDQLCRGRADGEKEKGICVGERCPSVMAAATALWGWESGVLGGGRSGLWIGGALQMDLAGSR